MAPKTGPETNIQVSNSSTASNSSPPRARKMPHCTKCKRPRYGHPLKGCPYSSESPLTLPVESEFAISEEIDVYAAARAFGSVYISTPHKGLPVAFTNGDGMRTNEGGHQKQAIQQKVQQASRPTEDSHKSHLWGFLQPCRENFARIDLRKNQTSYSVGRDAEGGSKDIVLPGSRVSEQRFRPRLKLAIPSSLGYHHCTITWDGKLGSNSCVSVHDLSSNGTFVSHQPQFPH